MTFLSLFFHKENETWQHGKSIGSTTSLFVSFHMSYSPLYNIRKNISCYFLSVISFLCPFSYPFVCCHIKAISFSSLISFLITLIYFLVKLGAQVIPKREVFEYMTSLIQGNGRSSMNEVDLHPTICVTRRYHQSLKVSFIE